MTVETETPGTRGMRNRLILVLVLLVCAGPLLLAIGWYLLYSGGEGLQTRNHGELVHPAYPLEARPLEALAGPHAGETREFPGDRTWTLVQVAPRGCDQTCRQALWSTRQGRLALGRDMGRVKRVLIASSEALERDFLVGEHRDLTVFDLAAADALVAELRSIAEPEPGRIYLIDPLGNVMMTYPPGHDAQGLIKDLEHLLKASRIG
jgi:hypothetical protein